MSDNALQLYNQRVNRQVSAICFEEHDRVPVYGLVDNWMLYYGGITVKQALENHELERDVYNKGISELKLDYVLAPLIQLPSKAVRMLGGIAATDTDVNQIQTGLSELMKAEEYDEFIKEPIGFMLNNIVTRRHPEFAGRSAEENCAVIEKYYQLLGERGMQMGRNLKTLKEEYGIPVSYTATSFTPTDFILDYLRDFKGIMTDIRRIPEKVNAASLALLEPILTMVEAANPAPREDKLLPIFTHIPGFLSPKAFEKVYWQQFKKYIEYFASKGHRWGILFEKNWSHLYDFLKELPKKCILGFFEEDDICVASKELEGKICVAGGVRANDLYYKDAAECIDAVKKVIDNCAPRKGFVLSPDKVMHTQADGKPENFKAVIEFAIEYGKY